MADSIRLELSLADRFTAEIKRHKESLTSFGKSVDETKFKFQFAWAQIEDRVKQFTTTPAAQQIKRLASVMASGLKRMEAGWDNLKLAAARAGGGIGRVVGNIRSALTSLPALIASSAAAMAFGAAVKQGIEFNAQIESLQMQFQVLTKDATRANNIMKELVTFAARTPYELGEVAATAKTLMAFGLTGQEWLRRVGDAAAAANQPITEMAGVFGRIASGAFGEAFQRLAETGIATRKMLEGEGLKFDKGGSYVGSVDQALEAVSRIVDTRFSGMMEKLSGTWQGKMSTLKDDIGMVLGVATGRFFDRLKPKLDMVDRLLQKIATGGAAAAFGERLLGPVERIIDRIISWLQNPEKALGKVLEWGDRVAAVVRTIGAGIHWTWDVMRAFVSWAMAGFERLGLKFDQALSKIGLAEWGDEQKKQLAEVELAFSAAGAKLKETFAQPGGLQKWRDEMERIKTTVYDVAVLGAKAGGNLAAILSGKSSGPGLDAPPSFARTPAWKPPRSASADRIEARLRAEQDLDQAISDMRLANYDITQKQLDLLDQQWMERKKEIYADYYAQLADLGQNLFVDSMTTLILEDAENMKQALDGIWQNMKASFVRSTLGMVAAWIRGRIKMAVAEKMILGTSTAAQLQAAGPKVAALTGETSAAAGAAAAEYHAATAWLGPFGAGIAAGLVAQMNATIAATKLINMVPAARTGMVVPGGGSGNEDDRLMLVSGGEGILNRRAVDAYGGRKFVDDINSLRLNPGGGGTINVPITINGGGMSAREMARTIEKEFVPVLERLARQGRFRVVLQA